MRGKAIPPANIKKSSRITPAYAGKSCFGTAAACQARDHPRVCGEKTVLPHNDMNRKGSPPRMRGKVVKRNFPDFPARITPAYAGKSFMLPVFGTFKGDHPRVCGEKLKERKKNGSQLGSPPRMRGKASRTRFNRDQTRITPAYAGKRLKQTGLTMQE